MALRTHARFPDVPAKAGHYESFYLKAAHPSEPLAVWIRHTVHKAPGERPVGNVWFVLFDANADGPRASKVALPPDRVGAGADHYIRVGDTRLEPGRAVGAAKSEQLDASWDLSFECSEEPYFHLRDWMYRAPVPRTKLLSPYPDARFSGRVQAGERQVELDGWPGMVGHNWGSQHAERWIWMQAAGLDSAGAWLDASIGRVKVGPLTTPWIANGRLSLGGRNYALGGPERVRATEVDERPEGCEFVLPGKGVTVRGKVGSEPKNFVGWIYSDPDGSQHNTVNCSVSDMELVVSREGEADVELGVRGGAAYELGMRERDHGIPIQPFPDP